MRLEDVKASAEEAGLAWRGAFHPGPEDMPDDAACGTLVMLGFAGAAQWPGFTAAAEYRDGRPHPLDRWSHRVISSLARELGARPYFPFLGPPFAPFILWAEKAEPVHRSAMGMMIHPDFGLWHAWRGALAFEHRFELPRRDLRPSPCDACRDKPCITACPVDAFASGDYDVPKCAAHITRREGAECVDTGCRSRRACPVGAEYRYSPEQAAFHMRAFIGRPLR